MNVRTARKVVRNLHSSNPGISLEAAKQILKNVGFNKKGELTKLRKEGKHGSC